jgi:hypothetical protein
MTLASLSNRIQILSFSSAAAAAPNQTSDQLFDWESMIQSGSLYPLLKFKATEILLWLELDGRKREMPVTAEFS